MATVELKRGEKAVVIPDVHNKWRRAEAIIRAESPDRVVFTGDYFDDHGDTPDDAASTAEWLARSLADETRVHLVGNHDINYMSRLEWLGCSGYDPRKRAAIDRCGVDWRRLKPFCWLGEGGGREDGRGAAWLCTHAGLSAPFLDLTRPGAAAADVDGVIGSAQEDLDRINDADHGHPFLQAGMARGGMALTGGIVWCDYNAEYRDVPGLRQIFGHTRGTEPRHGTGPGGAEHHCLDTSLCHYATFADGVVAVHAVEDLSVR